MKAWTTKEIQYLIKNALLAETNEVLNLQEMAKKLNRTVQSVRNKVYNLQRDGDLPKVQRELAIDSYKRPWTEREDKRLLAMRNQGQTYLEIANELERTVTSVSNRAARLIKNNKAKPLIASWTADQISVLIDNVKFDENGFVHNYEELARLTGMKYSQVQGKVQRLRKTGKITVMPIEGTTNVKSKEAMQRFNDQRFAHVRRKENSDLKKEMNKPKSNPEITSKHLTVIITTIVINGIQTDQYFLPNGELLAIKRLTPPASNESANQSITKEIIS